MQYVEICASLTFLFLVLFATEIRAGCLERPSLNNHWYMDRKLLGHEVNHIKDVLSPYACADECLRDPRCKSFNFKRKRNSSDINECYLNDVTRKETASGAVIKKPGTDLYDVDFEGLQKVCMILKVALFVSEVLQCDSNESY